MKFSLLLYALLLCPVIAQAQIKATTDNGRHVILNADGTWKYQAAQAEPPTKTFEKVAYNFTVSSNEWDVTITERVREYSVNAIKRQALYRGVMVLYKIASTDRREDQEAALLLGCSAEDAFKIDAVGYVGIGHPWSPEVEYIQVAFYVGSRLVATRDIEKATDPYNAKGGRIFNRAWAQHQNEKSGAVNK